MMNRRRKTTNTGRDPACPFWLCPAKTYQNQQGETQFGRSVFNHCQIVGETARALLNRMPTTIRQALFPTRELPTGRRRDIGKISPVFFLNYSVRWRGSTPLGYNECLSSEQYRNVTGVAMLVSVSWPSLPSQTNRLFLESPGSTTVLIRLMRC